MGRIFTFLVCILSLLLITSCDGEPQVAEQTVPEVNRLRPDLSPLIEGEVSSNGIKIILGTGDLSVGLNRFGFVLTSKNGFVTHPIAKLTLLRTGSSKLIPNIQADFHPWPYGERGLYVTWINFDESGLWTATVTVEDNKGTAGSDLEFEVRDSHIAPSVGDLAIASATKTLHDVTTMNQLTTGSIKDPDLYQISLEDALANGLPTVVVFASPAFCINAVCGPQIEVLQQLKNKYPQSANFIHVDFYDNPDEIQGFFELSRLSPAVSEWDLPSAEWTFIIDAKGFITSRLEAFATFAELEVELKKVI